MPEAIHPLPTPLLTPGGNLEACFQRHFQKTAQILLLQSDPCQTLSNALFDQKTHL